MFGDSYPALTLGLVPLQLLHLWCWELCPAAWATQEEDCEFFYFDSRDPDARVALAIQGEDYDILYFYSCVRLSLLLVVREMVLVFCMVHVLSGWQC